MHIPTDDNIKTITDMRENALMLLKDLKKGNQPTIIFHHNSPKAVMLSVKKYNELMDMLEDYMDGELARKLEKEKSKKTDYIPFKKVLKEHNLKIK
jgi:PHD/YefM family antitoxin component YafN of YafNO toxin-antitoxin module